MDWLLVVIKINSILDFYRLGVEARKEDIDQAIQAIQEIQSQSEH